MDRNRFVEMFLRFLSNRFGRFLRLSPPGEVAANEVFTRFLVHKRQFALTKGRVLPPALKPELNPETHRWETSTYRIDGLQAHGIWALGYQYVEDLPKGRRIRARGTSLAASVTDAGLHWDVNGEPYPRHADIIGWSVNDKDIRMMAATEIANKMSLEMDPRGG